MTEFVRDRLIPDVILVIPKRYNDPRGYFEEVYVQERFVEKGISCTFMQDNHSRSIGKGIVRGLHFQTPPYAQDKLVRCTRGRVLDIAVDVRQGSPTFGRYTSAELSEENGHQFFVPIGFAHAFCTLEEDCEVQYKVSNKYSPENDAGLAFDDPNLSIKWPFPNESLILSEKDKKLPTLSALESPFTYNDRN